ncbi:MAG: metal-dependent hydrolase [Verrucomicrobiales bacterium]|nr:metal-dependent hydrolase [Verrucomicrobiales bacterium]
MRYIEPHAHMVSRTTSDYEALAYAGCKAVNEPAFWAGFDRSSGDGFYDYFRQITEYEPKRAAKFCIDHYCWLCINPKEAEDVGLAREVISIIPNFIPADNVLGIGEIGLNKNSKNELLILEEHIQLAADHDQMILVHTPHLEDKLKGTKLIVDALNNQSKIDPSKVIIDHVEEHTANIVLSNGYWAGMTLYPESKVTHNRAIDMLEMFGDENVWLNSACDWGISDPLSVPKAALEMRRRGYDDEYIDKIVYKNPVQFMSQSGKFKLH